MTHAQESLAKAVSGNSVMNYSAIISGFMEKGLLPQDIKPRENVFTFHAWKALSRVVRKGEHGVKVLTWIEKDDGTKYPKTTTVFHISQTQVIA